MKQLIKYIVRHLLTIWIGFPMTLMVWFVLNFPLHKLFTGHYPPTYNEVDLIPVCTAAATYLLAFIPFATALDWLVVRRLRWKAWQHMLLVALALVVVTLIFKELFGHGIHSYNWQDTLVDALRNAIWGSTYWAVFGVCGYLLPEDIGLAIKQRTFTTPPWWLVALWLGVPGFFWMIIFTTINGEQWPAHWRSLGTLPDRPTKIVNLDPAYISGMPERIFDWWDPFSTSDREVDLYGKTENGNTYHYDNQKHTWIIASLPASYHTASYSDCSDTVNLFKEPAFTRLPHKILLCGQVIWQWEYINEGVYFVALEDNSVWMWHYRSGIDTSFDIFCWTPLTLIVIALAILWLLRKVRRRKEQTPGKFQARFIISGLGVLLVTFLFSRLAAPWVNMLGGFLLLIPFAYVTEIIFSVYDTGFTWLPGIAMILFTLLLAVREKRKRMRTVPEKVSEEA